MTDRRHHSAPTQCPCCGQKLRECPVCGVGVLPRNENPNGVIDEHKDKIGHACQAAGLDYRHTKPPSRGAA
jgi:hypothetical protein